MAAKVIVVEPDEQQRDEFKAAIRGSAFEVCDFVNTNGEALALYDKVHPHLIVLRMVSGKLGAAAALDALRKKYRTAKAVVSYDVQSTHLLMAAYSHGAVEAIKQPFRQHRVVEKLMHASASERHEKLSGPIVRLEHPVQVRYKTGSFFSRPKVGFCERLGLSDMDLNVIKAPKIKSTLKVEILMPPPEGARKFVGVVEDTETLRPDSNCCYVSLKNVSEDDLRLIEAFLVKNAKRV
ncbi:MAG: hypothetical protein NTU88_11850 [Armatimonadetes bacterium]|nr:hypothetical protein [Armatimonadota bacterium]